MADLRIVDAPVLLQESITDDVKMPTGGLGNYAIRLGDLVWYVVAKENLASKSYVDTSSKGVQDKLDNHIANKTNPHQVTKEQVGLGNVDNTADVDKPVSNATKSAIATATTDMATKAYVNSRDGDLSTLKTADKTNLVKAINEVVSVKADKATTLAGYGISDAYTKSEIDTNYGGVKTLYNKNVEAGAGANGWTTDLVVENGLTQKQINEVQKLKNKQLVTPFDFGAIGDGVYHKLSEKYTTLADAQVKYPTAQSLDDSIDLCALEAFFDHCHDNLVNANITLNAYVNRPLYVGMIRKNHNFKTKVYSGDLSLTNTQTDVEIPFLMRINAVSTEWMGKLSFNGTSGTVKDRKQLGGLVIGDNGTDGSSGRVHISSVHCSNFKLFGLALSNDSIFPRIDNVYSGGIGSLGKSYVNDKNNHGATITSFTNVDGQNNQYSLVTVDSIPSEFKTDGTYAHAMVMFEGDPLPYRIQSVNPTTNEIKVYPRLNNNLTYGKLTYIYGCGMFWTGNNAGAGNFGHLQFILCGIGFWGRSLYGANINYLSTEVCGCGVTVSSQSDVVIGYNVNNAYFEGNVWDYIQQWSNTHSPLIDFGMTHGLSGNKIAELTSWRVGVWNEARSQDQFNASKITVGNRTYITDQNYSTSVDLSDPRDILPVVISSGELLLTYSSTYEKISNLLGKKNKILVITQNGGSGTPAPITIKVPTDWSLNGVLNGTVTTNPQKFATVLTVVKDADKSLRIFGESLYKTTGTTAERPSKAPTGFVYIDTTLNKPVYKTATSWVDATGTTV